VESGLAGEDSERTPIRRPGAFWEAGESQQSGTEGGMTASLSKVPIWIHPRGCLPYEDDGGLDFHDRRTPWVNSVIQPICQRTTILLSVFIRG
jgi:hypothetical protein